MGCYRVMELKAQVINMPSYEPQKYVVARLVDGQLWYYSGFRKPSEAEYCANRLDNALVLKYEMEDEDDRR